MVIDAVVSASISGHPSAERLVVQEFKRPVSDASDLCIYTRQASAAERLRSHGLSGDCVRVATIRKLSRESGIGGCEEADLRDSIPRQLKEMLNGLQGKGF